MTRKTWWVALAMVLVSVGLAGAWWMKQGSATGPAAGPAKGEVMDGVVQDGSGKRVLYWHDPMTPGQKFDKPGKSPFMDMALVPQYADDEADAGNGIRIPSSVVQNLGVRIGQAEVAVWGSDLQALGRVAFDEHDVRSVQTRVGGFIERLYVRAVGDAIGAGQKIADVYAPDLLAAQHELLALRTLNVPDLDALQAAARERLRLLGMNDTEISAIEAAGAPRRRVGVYAPVAGVVQELGMREGAQVMPGQTLLQIAGLERVWVLVDLPERDLGRVRTGQAATVRFAALPDADFRGKVEYVYPKLDAAARTGQVRIQVANPKGRLRPGMYAQVNLAAPRREALTVPAEAVIVTGTRALVIVRENGTFRPAEVKTGSEADGRTEILAGLKAGEEVVLSGQFLIDSEASLKGMLARLSAGKAASPAATPKAPSATVSGTGIVKEVDPERGRVTLAHGPIPALQWPAMTMSFKLRDPKAAANLKPGANVSFRMTREPEGSDYVIESIAESAK